MDVFHRAHAGRRAAPALLITLMLAAVLVLPRPGVARADDNGCDPSEAVACLAPPAEEPVDEDTARGTPTAAAPAPPIPCVAPPTDTAAAAEVPLRCFVGRDVVVAVNRANVVYVRALRTLDTSELAGSWGGEALADLEGQIAVLRGAGRFATPQLLSITLRELSVGRSTARVRTAEHWIYQERARRDGALLLEMDEWVENVYTLNQIQTLVPGGPTWIVVRDVISFIDAPPLPVLVVSARVTTDRDSYTTGESVQGTLTNDGSVPVVIGGGGFACGLLRIEWFGPNGWQKAPIPEPLIPCRAIARILAPGESHTELLPTGTQPGIYRLAVSYSAEGVEGVGGRTASSAPYVVR